MHITDGRITFSPSDLADFASCSHVTTLALRDLDARLPRKAASEELAILQGHGVQNYNMYRSAIDHHRCSTNTGQCAQSVRWSIRGRREHAACIDTLT